MKRSKSSTIILIATLCMILAASAPALPQTDKMGILVKGIAVVVKRNPPKGAAHKSQTNAQGSFTINGLEAGLYDLRLECKACESMEIGEAGVQLTLTGTKESNFKRVISKQQLVDGVKFDVEIAGRGKESRALKGIVSLIK